MTTTIRLQQFERLFSDGRFALDRMPPGARDELEQLVRELVAEDPRIKLKPEELLARLRTIAGEDGVISGRAELRELFRWIDEFDHDGSRGSIVADTKRPSLKEPRANRNHGSAGRVLQLLAEHYERAETLTLDAFTRGFRGRVVDLAKLERLSPAQRALLDSSGVLEVLRQPDSQNVVIDRARAAELFRRIDALDQNLDGTSLIERFRAPDEPPVAPREGRRTQVPAAVSEEPAGDAIAALRLLLAAPGEAPSAPQRPAAPPPPVAPSVPSAPPPAAARPPVAPAPPSRVLAPAVEPNPELPYRPVLALENEVDKLHFTEFFARATIDLDAISAADRERLSALGVPWEELVKASSGKGKKVLRGAKELGAAFDLVWRGTDQKSLDPKRKDRVLRCTQSDFSSAPTRAGSVVALLERYAEHRVVADWQAFNERFGVGWLDTRLLADKALAEDFKAMGVSPQALREIAGRGGVITDQAQLRDLYNLLKRSLGVKTESGFVTHTRAYAPTVGGALEVRQTPTRAASALSLLEQKLFRRYEQGYETYTDVQVALARARVVPAEQRNPQESPITYVRQKTDRDCWYANDEMVRVVKGKASRVRQAESPLQSHYMARSKDEKTGRIAGFKSEMEAGLRYIDWVIDNKLRVSVGVSRRSELGLDPEKKNNDNRTNHFLTIYKRDYDEQGRVRYWFKDSAAENEEQKTGRFLVDARSGMLYLDPSSGAAKNSIAREIGYQVTQVRPLAQIPGVGEVDPMQHFATIAGSPAGGLPGRL